MTLPSPKNFIAYHSVALRGGDLHRTQPVSFASRKGEKLLQRARGQRVWFIVGRESGRHTRFWFAGVYTPSRIQRSGDEWVISGPGSYCDPEVELTNEAWFVELKRAQSNFSLGFNDLVDPRAIQAFEALMESQTGAAPTTQTGARSFQQAEAFPVIAEIIHKFGADSFVSQKEIVASLIQHPVGAVLVASARARSSWPDDRAAATNMVSWFSQAITMERSEWSDAFYREHREDGYAYRARSASAADLEFQAFEGEPQMVLHLHRERSRELAKAKRDEARRKNHGLLRCEACGFASEATYPTTALDVYEVHHRAKLSTAASGRVSSLEDLAVLCANCHRAIHRTTPMMTVEELRRAIASTRESGDREAT